MGAGNQRATTARGLSLALLSLGFGLRRRGFLGFCLLGGLGFGAGGRSCRKVHPLENGALACVTLALAELHDPGVTAVTFLLAGDDLVKEDLNGVLLVQPRGREPTI